MKVIRVVAERSLKKVMEISGLVRRRRG